MSNYIDQIITLSEYVVENVRENDATFIQFFGDPKYHPNVMEVFSRLADIKRTTLFERTELHIVAYPKATEEGGEIPTATSPNGNVLQAWATYNGFKDQPTITLYPVFATLYDVFDGSPAQTFKGQLQEFKYSKQFILLHELMHFVGDVDIGYPRVLPKTTFWSSLWSKIYEGPFDGGQILDVRIAGAAGRREKKWLSEQMDNMEKERLEAAVVYGERNTLLLPQLKYGSKYAVHNSENYAMFVWALLINWNANEVYVPERGDAAFWYKTAVKRDPFEDLPPPFRSQRENKYDVFWLLSGRRDWMA
ncbi:hypothetical protein HYFRA_00004625 [Hymenoscyphus fraxineus]|uniref:Uncharacterized protein n=1 Tax=Hymenoscyphus fraxineus TaxID=746836 RepID=A0A9N9L0A7_9HELO|nr:hypothetical protein HYFRA_00004625 [Hymenoscyphus fraxineus]